MLEIGAWLGRSAIGLASTARSVVSVDPHRFGPPEMQSTLEPMLANLERYGVRERVEVLVGTSGEVLPTLPPRSFDLIFVDADHAEEAVREDLGLALPLLRPGGVLAFHDYGEVGVCYHGTWFDWGVTAVVDELAARLGTAVEQVGTLAVVRVDDPGAAAA